MPEVSVHPTVRLKGRRAQPFFSRHPWVYAGAIEEVVGEPADGSVVDLLSAVGTFIARGLFNSRSKIRVRLYSWAAEQALDGDFFRAKFERAIALRRDVLGWDRPGAACRLIFSEGDGISGLTVDKFDRWLVLQFTALGLAERRHELAQILLELTGCEGAYLRTERGIGKLEGIDLSDGPLAGSCPSEPIEIDELGIRYAVNLSEGQKTGFYLDQRLNREAAARYAKGRDVLDAFCYSGGFGLHAARAGAKSVTAVDVSEAAIELARRNAAANGLTLDCVTSDVFDYLSAQRKAARQFDMVILDPPKFARAKHAVPDALRGYRRLQSVAIDLLRPGGILVMCCCSGLVTRDMLEELQGQVAADSKRDVQILERHMQPPDHPVAASCLESSYLKCVISRVG